MLAFFISFLSAEYSNELENSNEFFEESSTNGGYTFTVYYYQSDFPNGVTFKQGGSSSRSSSCVNGDCKSSYTTYSSTTLYITVSNSACSNYQLFSGTPREDQTFNLKGNVPSQCRRSRNAQRHRIRVRKQ